MAEDRKPFENLTASDFAARFGVTPRALRVYERAGLLKPLRTQAGWRVYGAREADALYQVLALKALGLTLARIGAAMRSADLAQVLAAQQDALEESLAAAQTGLRLVRAARARLSGGDSLSADDLVTLIKETAMNTQAQEQKYMALVERHLGSNVADLIPPGMSITQLAELQEEWRAVIAEGEEKTSLDPASAEAQEYGRRLGALIWRSARDEGELERQTAFFDAAFSDPELAGQMPFSRAFWEWTKEVKAHMEAMDGAV